MTPRREELYFSSWIIRAGKDFASIIRELSTTNFSGEFIDALHFLSIINVVKSREGDGQLSTCEVILLHYEDMGIPKDVGKLGVWHRMWER